MRGAYCEHEPEEVVAARACGRGPGAAEGAHLRGVERREDERAALAGDHEEPRVTARGERFDHGDSGYG